MKRHRTLAGAGLATGLLAALVACGGGESAQNPAIGATLHTTAGDIELTLFPDQAPEAVENFAGLAEGEKAMNNTTGQDEFFDGTIFHRVIEGYIIQGGSPDGTNRGGPGYEFADEIGPSSTFDEPGRLAMANYGPDTNGSQFFITVEAVPALDGDYTIFGEVADADSQYVVEQISNVETDTADRPEEDVVVESVTIRRR